jgi:hypothetical protein
MKTKYFRINKFKTIALAILVAITTLQACKKDIVVQNDVPEKFSTYNDSYGYLKNSNSESSQIKLDIFTSNIENSIYFGLTKAAGKDISAIATIDANAVEEFNKKNLTSFLVLPSNVVTFTNNATLNIKAGDLKSNEISFTIAPNTNIAKGTYILPITIKKESIDGISLNEDAKTLYYVVNINGNMPDAKKASGIVSICYVEVNSDNILNVGSYKLANSGKPFFDIAMIFAANINFDPTVGKAVIYLNPNVKHILLNRDKYIKPLQDKGIKVSLTILGTNGGGLGLANLPDANIPDYAKQLKALVDVYGLDGIDFDDEWTSYNTGGFPSANRTSYGRLLIELRKIMPNKLITLYHIGNSSTFNTAIDGVNIGSIIDYAYYPYYGSYSTAGATSILGLGTKKWGPAPIAFHGTNGNLTNPSPSNPTTSMNNLVNGGYGVNVMYNIRSKYNGTPVNYIPYLTQVSNILYKEATVLDGPLYDKDF